MRGASAVVVCGSLAVVAAVVAAPAGHAGGSCRPGVLRPVGTPTAAFAAEAIGRTSVYRHPHRARLATLPRMNELGATTTFLIVGAILNRSCDASWYRVKLPMRPNGSVGYVRSHDVAVTRVNTRVAVDLSRRELSFYRRGRRVLTTPVAVGSPSSPTPIGRYYVNQRIRVQDTEGPFGPGVLGLSAFSKAPTDWGAELIGIHGTNAPWSIGRAASHGCIRVPNTTLARLFAAIPAGTPVVIHP
jgi:hypothetical protein